MTIFRRLGYRFESGQKRNATPASNPHSLFVCQDGNRKSAGLVPPGADVEDGEDAMELFVEEVLGSHPASYGDGNTSSGKVGFSGIASVWRTLCSNNHALDCS